MYSIEKALHAISKVDLRHSLMHHLPSVMDIQMIKYKITHFARPFTTSNSSIWFQRVLVIQIKLIKKYKTDVRSTEKYKTETKCTI